MVQGELALCGEDQRGSAGGQAMVGSDRRGEDVSTPVGNPPSRRDPRTGLPHGACGVGGC